MSLAQIRYFLQVAEEGNVGRAAERLRVAQPAVSRQIRNLESELGATLFERNPRGMRLTPSGERFLTRARNILKEVDSATAAAPGSPSPQLSPARPSAMATPHTPEPESQEDRERAIVRTALDYIEGWLTGDAERMERALSPDLAKRVVEVMEGAPDRLRHTSALALVQWTRAGRGVRPSADSAVDVTVFDVSERSASAKIRSADMIDYLHLARLDGRWVIVNVLWEPINRA